MKKRKTSAIIIGEGITEQYYFESLKDILNIRPNVVPQKHSSLHFLEKSIKEQINQGYRWIYCLIDMDNKVPDNQQDHNKNNILYSKLRKKYHNKQFKTREGVSEVVMVESYPSTELFFLYYFGYTGAHYSNDQLKKILYEKVQYKVEQNFFIKNPLHILFEKKGGSLLTAIEASILSMKASAEGNGASYTEIGKLIRELLS